MPLYKNMDDVIDQLYGDAMEGIFHTQEGRGKNRIDYFLLRGDDPEARDLFKVDPINGKQLIVMLNKNVPDGDFLDFDFNLVRWLRKNCAVGRFE